MVFRRKGFMPSLNAIRILVGTSPDEVEVLLEVPNASSPRTVPSVPARASRGPAHISRWRERRG